MARKKPAAMVALDAVKPACATVGCEGEAILSDQGNDVCLDCYEKRARERASASIRSQGVDLSRRPNEPIDRYRKRCMDWLRENARIKRMGQT